MDKYSPMFPELLQKYKKIVAKTTIREWCPKYTNEISEANKLGLLLLSHVAKPYSDIEM